MKIKNWWETRRVWYSPKAQPATDDRVLWVAGTGAYGETMEEDR